VVRVRGRVMVGVRVRNGVNELFFTYSLPGENVWKGKYPGRIVLHRFRSVLLRLTSCSLR